MQEAQSTNYQERHKHNKGIYSLYREGGPGEDYSIEYKGICSLFAGIRKDRDIHQLYTEIP